MKRCLRLVLVLAVALPGVLSAPPAAHAWWRGGFGFGFVPMVPGPYPYYYPPPVYYPPPIYVPPPVYAVPPVYAAPSPAAPSPAAPSSAAPSTGQTCYAGQYVCPLTQPSPTGAPCSCPTNDSGRVGGRVG